MPMFPVRRIATRLPAWLTRQRVPAGAMAMRDPEGEARLAVRFAVFYCFAAIATGLLIRGFPLPYPSAYKFNQDLWYLVVFKIGLLGVVPLAAFLRRGYRIADLCPGWRLRPKTVLTLLLAFGFGFFINAGHLKWIAATETAFPPGERLARIALGAATALPMAGWPEEFFFRGILQTRLERTRGRFISILVTSLLFVAWHLPTRYLCSPGGVEGNAGDLTGVLLGTGVPVFVAGLIFCLAWDRWRSLPVLVALHWGIDTLPAISSYLGIRF